jgi:O-antigen ligase
VDFVFPHNFFLEILYLNGIVGLILVFGGLGLLCTLIVNQASKSPADKYYLLIRCLIVIFVSWLIHGGLNFPFYAKYSLYPLAFILGPMLVVLEQRDS